MNTTIINYRAHAQPCHGAVVFRRDLFQEVEGRTERAPGGMDNEVDCTAAAASRDMIEILRSVDADHGPRAFPARPVVAVALVTEVLGDPLERDGAEPVGPCRAGLVHGASSRVAFST